MSDNGVFFLSQRCDISILTQRLARCLFYVCVKCKSSFQTEKGVRVSYSISMKSIHTQVVEMIFLTLLVIVNECFASHIIPHHKLKFDCAVAHGHLIEILSNSKYCTADQNRERNTCGKIFHSATFNEQ